MQKIIIDGKTIVESINFINIEKILTSLPWVNILNIVSEKGTGKSVSTQKYMEKKYIRKGKHTSVIRNRDTEVDQSVVDPFIAILENNKYDLEKWRVNKKGIYNKNKRIVYFVYLSRLATFSGVNAKCEFIHYDEFIDGNQDNYFTLKDFSNEFSKLLDTITRPMPFKLVATANPHNAEPDYLIGMGINHNWDIIRKGECDIFKDKSRGILSLWFPDKWFKIKLMQGTKKQVATFKSPFDKRDTFRMLPESAKRVYPWDENIAKSFVPMFNLTYNDSNFCIGRLFKDNEQFIYIKELFNYDEFMNVPYYATEPEDVRDWNVFDENADCIDRIYHHYISAHCLYSSDFCKQEMQDLLSITKYKNNFI